MKDQTKKKEKKSYKVFYKENKMARIKKTISIGLGMEPDYSFCTGKVGVKEFNKAFKAEGWSGDSLCKSDLKFGSYKRGKKGTIIFSEDVKAYRYKCTYIGW
jgi:hypothetical protein